MGTFVQEFRKRAQSGQPSNVTLVHCRLKAKLNSNNFSGLRVATGLSDFQHRVITSRTFKLPASKVFVKEVMDLAKEHLPERHVLCPGLLGVVDLQGELGYIPETVRLINGPVTTVHSKRCKIWHIPARNLRADAQKNSKIAATVKNETNLNFQFVTRN